MLTVFDMMGNGPIFSEGYQKMLSQNKDFFSQVVSLGLETRNQQGIKVLCNSNASYHIQTEKGETLEELYPEEQFWARLLSCYGIANIITESKDYKNEILAVSGQYFRNIKSQEIAKIFKDNVIILDAKAVEVLYDLGLRKLAGVKKAKWLKQNSGVYSYEEVCNGKNYCGLTQPRISAELNAGDVLDINYSEDVKIKSMLKNPKGERVANGVVIYNKKVIIFPYGHFSNFPVCHLTPVRQQLFQQTFKEIARKETRLTFTLGYPYLPIYRYDFPNRIIFLIFNASSDDLHGFQFYASSIGRRAKKVITLDSHTGKERYIAFEISPNGYYSINQGIKSCEGIVLIIGEE